MIRTIKEELMRYRSLGWIMMGAWIGALPIAAHADYLVELPRRR